MKGSSQAGYGCWYDHDSPENFSAYVPVGERESKNTAELRAVLHALQNKPPYQKVCVILDAKNAVQGGGTVDVQVEKARLERFLRTCWTF